MPLTFSLPTPYGANQLHTALPLPRRRPPRLLGLVIRVLNIRDGHGFGMAQAIRVVERGGFDVMLLTKTKISTTAYFWHMLEYKVT